MFCGKFLLTWALQISSNTGFLKSSDCVRCRVGHLDVVVVMIQLIDKIYQENTRQLSKQLLFLKHRVLFQFFLLQT